MSLLMPFRRKPFAKAKVFMKKRDIYGRKLPKEFSRKKRCKAFFGGRRLWAVSDALEFASQILEFYYF